MAGGRESDRREAGVRASAIRRSPHLLRRVGHARRQHPVDRDSKHADPFTTVIRCTADGKPDSKTISKWPRALRYVARAKKPRHQLMAFMKGRGAVNGCAALYAQGRAAKSCHK